ELARVGIPGRDRAAADVALRLHDRLPHRDLAPDPLVLLVRTDAVDLEQHAEAPPVDGPGLAGLFAHALEGRARDERGPAAEQRAAVDRAALGPEQRQRLAGEGRQRLLPRPRDGARRVRLVVEDRLDRLAGLDDTLD